MIELFTNIPDYIKIQAKFWIDLALQQQNTLTAVKMIDDYRNSCINEDEKKFVDFYFNMRMGQLLNEDNND